MPTTTLADILINQPLPYSHHHRSGSSIQFGELDKVFSNKLLPNDQSINNNNNPSFRVYYCNSTGSIPFVWETAPGTPKHALFLDDDATARLPPLTPPPGFDNSTLVARRSVCGGDVVSVSSSSRRSLLDGFLQRLRSSKSKADVVAPSNYLSSSPSSNSASSEWSGAGLIIDRYRLRKWRSLSIRFRKRHNDAPLTVSPDSTLCFGSRREKSTGGKASLFGGCFRA